jgi:hypothetical protein
MRYSSPRFLLNPSLYTIGIASDLQELEKFKKFLWLEFDILNFVGEIVASYPSFALITYFFRKGKKPVLDGSYKFIISSIMFLNLNFLFV